MTKINIRESLKHLDEDTFCKYDLTTLYDSCVLDDKDKKLIVKMLYDKEDPEVIYQKLCMYFDDDEIADIDEFMLDTPTQGKYESIIKKCVDKLSETYKDVKYNDVANQLEFTDGNQQFAIGLCPFTDIDTDDYELFIDYNYDTPCCFNTEQEVLKYILNFIKNKINHLDDSDAQTCDDNMVYTVYDIIEDDNRLTAKCMNESTNDFKDIKLGKIKTEKVIELINNMLNNPDYKVTDAVRQKIAKNSAPWGLAVQMTPSVDIDATNSLLSTGDFGGEVSFGESVEETFEKEDRVTDGDRQGTVLDSDSQKVLVEWDYSETDDIEWVDKSTLELVSETNSGFLPNMEYCPACGGTRFNVKTGVCIDCGYNEGDWGYTNTDDYDDLDESKNTIVTGKEAEKYLWNKIENLKDIKGYWEIKDDFINGGNITVVKDVSDVPNGYKYRFSFLDDMGSIPVEMDAYNNDLDWYIVDYLSDVKLEESVSRRYVWFDYNDIKDVKPKPQQVIDAYNHKYPDYDNPVTGIKEIEFVGRNYPEKEIHYIVTDNEGNQFRAVVGNLSKEINESSDSEYWYFTKHGVQPGSIPNNIHVLEIKDTPNGTYFKGDRVLTTKELQDYEIKEKSPEMKESKSIKEGLKEEFKKQLQDELYDKFIDLARTPDWGYENIKEIDDFINPIVEIEDYKGDYDNDIKVELRAEVNYRELEDVCDTLDKVVRKYDKNAYFEPVQPGIAVAYLKFPKKLKEDFEDDEIVTGEQEFDSAATSINSNKLPAVYSMVDFTPGQVVIDFGGGRFDNAVNYLKDKDVTLLVYDPYNRSAEHNKEVLRVIRENGGADAAINSNVLNVIKEPEARQQVLKNIKKLVKPGAPIYITVYEGSGKGNEGPTKAGYQLNRKTSGYIDEISQVFPNVKRKGKLITAINESFSSSGLRQANIDAIDYFTEFEDIYTFPKGKFLATDWKELRDGVAMGMDDDLEIAEGIMEYLQKEIDFNNKHKEIYEDDPQAELTLEVYNKVKKEYERAVSKLGLSETLSDRIKNNELDYDEEIDAYFAEEDNIYVQFQDRQTNTYQATKNSEKGLQIFDKQPRVSSNTWGRIWKDGKLVKSFEGPKYKVRADVIKYLDDNNKSEVLEETSYGGAFDIEDDQYFTKEDIMDLADEVCERLYKEVHETFDVSDLYMEGNTLHMELESDSCVVYTDVKIDMRKIRKPLDIMKYALPITNKLLKEIKEQLSM